MAEYGESNADQGHIIKATTVSIRRIHRKDSENPR